MTETRQRCPACGASGTGTFCSQCGGPLAGTQTERPCPQCGVQSRGEARYCRRCGAALTGAGVKSHTTLWIAASLVVLVLVVVIGLRATGGFTLTTPEMANAGNQPPGGVPVRAPDISQMSPRERFDRLFLRVMEAGAQGDSATVVDFTPMAIGAYEQLDRFDDVVRYRAALIRLQVGEFAGASALADTILASHPGHLLGLVIQGSVANFQGDSAGLDAAYREFLSHYDDEIASGRPAYASEQAVIAGFREAALAATN